MVILFNKYHGKYKLPKKVARIHKRFISNIYRRHKILHFRLIITLSNKEQSLLYFN